LQKTSQTFALIGEDEHLVRKTISVFDVALDQLPSVFRRRVSQVLPMLKRRGGKLGLADAVNSGAGARDS
jgi:hypothetical protein